MTPLGAVPEREAGTFRMLQEIGPRVRRDDDIREVARQFEALFVGQMLRAARAASLADDLLTGSGAATYTDMIDQARAQLIAAQAPLGVAGLLAK